MSYLNITRFMPTLLDRKDRMSMGVGLEVRVPYCDHRLVQYVFNIPWEIKTVGNREKGILRKALEGVLPDDVLYRKKSPYPKTHNPAYLNQVRSQMLGILDDPSSPILPLIDPAKIREIAASPESSSNLPWTTSYYEGDCVWNIVIIATDQREHNLYNYRKLTVFILVTFGFTWLCWLPLLLNKQFTAGLPVLPGQFYLGSFGPLLGLPLAYGAVAILVHTLITGNPPDMRQFGLTSDLPPQFGIWMTSLVWMLTFGIGEESGWRGYLLPQLHQRYSLFTSALLVAVIWMAWHLPAFWFNESYLGMGFGVLGWAISLTYGSVVLAWICAGSRWSILPVILWHGIFDLLTASDQAAEIMAMVCSMLVIIHGILLMKTLGKRSG
ncbi:hypothetical protein KC345_g10888 [Hortaea werneckii]|nr:hypothetical protein KC345_g10888 [Hortaea werneckii]